MDLYAAYNVVVYCYHSNVLCGAVTGGGEGGGVVRMVNDVSKPAVMIGFV